MMKKATYFEKIVNNLENDSTIELSTTPICFSTLKIMEYWVRILQKDPECVNKCVAFRLMSEAYLKDMCNEIVKLIVKAAIEEPFEEISAAAKRRKFRCRQNLHEVANEYKKNANRFTLTALLRILRVFDGDDVSPELGQEILKVIAKHFQKFALDSLKEGINENDPSIKRVQKTQEMFRLNDKELELLLYLWLRTSNDMEVEDNDPIPLRHRRFRDNDSNDRSLANISRATGLSMEDLDSLLGKNSSLIKLRLIDSDLDLLCDVHHYLSGISDEAGMKSFKIAGAPSVSFEQLQGKNPDAKLALKMLQEHKRERPLHILFYGTEGAGKTELAKAIATEVNRPLYEVSIDVDDDELGPRFFDRNSKLLQYRLRAMTLADWECEQEPGIIMMDEADLVLNNAEKGALNALFESIKTPVIWISNSMNGVEKSTLRRFNFSMHFSPLAKDERLSVLNSVLKTNKAENLLTEEEKLKLIVEYPAMAGGFTLAVQQTKQFADIDCTIDKFATMARILKAHTELLEIPNGTLKDVESHAPSYSLEGLNIDSSMEETLEVVNGFDEIWKGLEENDAPRSLNMLLYGPPGTGKTEFVRYLARKLGRNLVVKRASDLLNCYVGGTEARIKAAFAEAERTKAILFFDEADSFLQDRSGANRSWEVTQVNELLTQMENFKGIFIAATNFDKNLDAASRRRFALKIGFDYLKPEGIKHIWEAFFPNVECPPSAMAMPMLAPGDFNAVNGRMQYLPASAKTADRLLSELRLEINAKDAHVGRKMGF